MPDPLPPRRPVPPSPGGQLAPDDVVGRDLQIARAWELLDRASVRLNEPRRIGKTSLLVRLCASPPAGWQCVRQSFQGVTTRAEMAARALGGVYHHQRLSSRVKGRVRQFLAAGSLKATVDQVTFELSPSFRDDPVAALEAALRSVDEALDGERLVLVWDEVPDMVLAVIDREGADRAAELLSVLRRFRDEPANSSLRWLVTGSVGFHHALRQCSGGDALVNDLVNLSLGPLDGEWSRWLCGGLLLGADVEHDEDAVWEMAAVTDGIPFLAHLVAKQARDARRSPLRAGDARDLFDDAVADLDQSQAATHFLSRLGPYYGELAPAAEWVLDHVVDVPASRDELRALGDGHGRPLPADRELRDVLDWLCLDHYLLKDQASGRYRWRYPALGRVWTIRRV